MYYRRRLLFHGMSLFLIGLFTGLAEQHFANVRMALAAHLEGVTNGIFLLAMGAIWGEVKLPFRATSAAFWLLLGGTYGNWAVTTLAAVLGTAALSPITGAGQGALRNCRKLSLRSGLSRSASRSFPQPFCFCGACEGRPQPDKTMPGVSGKGVHHPRKRRMLPVDHLHPVAGSWPIPPFPVL